MVVQVNQDTMPTIDIEIIIWHVLAKWNCGTTIVAQVEDPGFDTKPINCVRMPLSKWASHRSKAYHRRYRAKATEICLEWILN